MSYLVLFSAIYLIVASISLVMGYYVLNLNPKRMINRLFLVISLCLTLWALGFSIVIVAPNEQSCVFWTKISAVGYNLIYSVLLHFTLLLTGNRKILSKKWLYPLLYLPTAVCLYAFVLSPDITQGVYHFKNTESGWIRDTGSIIYDYIFWAYYLGAVLASLTLIGLWKRNTRRPEIRRQANLLLYSFAAAFTLGTFTDVLNVIFRIVPLPQMAPLFFSIPLSAIFYCISKYHFMGPQELHKTEVILSDDQRSLVFRVTSAGFIVGGIIFFLLEYFWWKTDGHSLTVAISALLIGLGVSLYYVQRKGKGFDHLELLLILTGMTVTPLLTINMVQSGGMTMWTFPIMLVICALVFNSDRLLFSSSFAILFSQIYLSSVVPQKESIIDYRTYISRAVMIFFFSAAAYNVHRIYIKRLRENAAQARTQALINSIVAGFTLNDEENTAERMNNLLKELAGYFRAEIVMACAVEPGYSSMIGESGYCADGSGLSPENKLRCMERWEVYARENLALQSGSPYEQKVVPGQIEKMKATPWLFIPIYEKEKPVAFIHIETFRNGRVWTPDQITILPVISRIVSDALDKLNSEMRIQFMAYYDSLTRLPNRQLFHDRTEQAIHLARRNNKVIGILFIDLDSFKSINDTMGHEGGDLLLRTIGQELTKALRKSDTVARFGGDEFLILLNNIADVEELKNVADKVMDIFKKPMVLKEQEIFITASAGIAIFPADGEDAETLIKHADIAMYTAKEKGKSQYVFCSDNMKELVQYRATLSNRLYRALERNELQLYYQPQVDLQTERITGLEALLRWFHPELGMVPPLEFISLAEQTGLINPIGNWVLETACRQSVEWKKKGLGDLRIAVNLSVVQLRNPGLVRQVESILTKTGMEPSLVELEITESTTTKEPDYIIRVLNDLKSLGVSISIDDFGTEYSSLNRLKMLPIDRIKMDIQFVRGIDKSPKDQAITLIIMNLAKSLDLKLIAEGVESTAQLTFLKSRMCDEVQGFYYYKPMPAVEIESILAGRI